MNRSSPRIARILLPQALPFPGLAWAAGKELRIPLALLEAANVSRSELEGEPVRLLSRLQTLPGLAENLRAWAIYTDRKPASSRLPFSYHLVPAWARSLVASAIGRVQRRRQESWAAFPGWPLDLGADILADLALKQPAPRRTAPCPVILTHDLDSPEGVRNLARWFLPIEEAVGATSTSFLVPCAWPVDRAVIRETLSRGHEIGVHGFDHSNRTAFLPAAQRLERLKAARAAVEDLGGSARGYRAPSLLRTRDLLRDLALLFEYDSSIPSAGGLFPMPNNGCASARPFRQDGILELPLSMPRDGSLRFLGYSPKEVLRIWLDSARAIAASGGVVVLLTHCEARFSGTPRMRDAYRELLETLAASGDFAWTTPEKLLTPAPLVPDACDSTGGPASVPAATGRLP